MTVKTLILDAEHRYWLDGRQIPGLTQLLRHFGFIEEAYFTPESCAVGTAVHLGTESMDLGRQDHQQFENPAIIGRIQAYQRFKEEKGFRPYLIEDRKAHPNGVYACTLDRFGHFGDSPIGALIDLKTGGEQAWHALQTGGQARCLQTEGAMRRFSLYLKENGTYSLKEHKDHNDGVIVESLATAWWWQTNHNYKLKGAV